MHIEAYVDLLRERERELAGALLALADSHVGEPDVGAASQLLASWSQAHVATLDELRLGLPAGAALEPPPTSAPAEMHGGSYGLLLDLQGVWLLAQDVHLRWTVLGQVARALRNRELEATCAALGAQTDRQVAWLHTRMVEAAPQALIAAP